MSFRILGTLFVLFSSGSVVLAQDVQNPVRATTFATVGRPPAPTVLGGRCKERKEDWLDRYPCCGYGKVNTDMGVPGFRSTLSFYWGSGCEFFREECRRSTIAPYAGYSHRNDGYGQSFSGCNSCGK